MDLRHMLKAFANEVLDSAEMIDVCGSCDKTGSIDIDAKILDMVISKYEELIKGG